MSEYHSPRVSIIMATWKRADIISYAIESIVAQTFKNWELLIVDDGSPDNTAEVAERWEKQDGRIRYIQCPRMGNIAAVSNVGIRAARGEFIAILDDDDAWHDVKKLEKQVAFLERGHEYVACGGGFIMTDGRGKELGKIMKPEHDEDIRKVALFANPIANSTALFRKSDTIVYDENLSGFADWDFWLKLGKRGKLYNFPEYFLEYRMWDRGGSFIHQKENARAAMVIVSRYRDAYPGFVKAFLFAKVYWWYAHLPITLRKQTNEKLSKLKKVLFSKQ